MPHYSVALKVDLHAKDAKVAAERLNALLGQVFDSKSAPVSEVLFWEFTQDGIYESTPEEVARGGGSTDSPGYTCEACESTS